MKNIRIWTGVFLMTLFCVHKLFAAVELNTDLMRSTFKIEGPSNVKGEVVIGTAFILGLPSQSNPSKGYYVLVTAAHILEEITGTYAGITLRRKISHNQYEKLFYEFPVRDKGKPLWVRHPDPDIDVAAMFITLPAGSDIVLLSTRFLATDQVLEHYEIHPGDELMVLGFPYGVGCNDVDFPILRSGNIASFPITPVKKARSFLFDFQVFEGNSGGPVYCFYPGRFYRGLYHNQQPVQYIVGLVSRGVSAVQIKKKIFGVSEKKHTLVLAEVIPAVFILETIRLLPDTQS
ncbi:MAG: hypothetical protein Q8Q33_00910 [Chlamydiota bacterium]|nr:hypothetical protein [Chlamydiota bacterium]